MTFALKTATKEVTDRMAHLATFPERRQSRALYPKAHEAAQCDRGRQGHAHPGNPGNDVHRPTGSLKEELTEMLVQALIALAIAGLIVGGVVFPEEEDVATAPTAVPEGEVAGRVATGGSGVDGSGPESCE